MTLELISMNPANNSKHPHHKKIKSFALRQGRMSQRQRNAIKEHWPEFGIDWSPELVDATACFRRQAPLVLEIGFGMGDSLSTMMQFEPEKNFLGIEVHKPGVGALLATITELGSHNLRVICHDAVEVLQFSIPDKSLDRVQIYFPDPWHKKRHHKRRLITPDFLQLLIPKMKSGGMLHMATDWQNYAEQMLTVASGANALKNLAGSGHFSPRPKFRPVTKFEKRGEALGHGVWDLLFKT